MFEALKWGIPQNSFVLGDLVIVGEDKEAFHKQKG